jgi:ATP-dependent Clp protease ATP-binding subunit ClpC
VVRELLADEGSPVRAVLARLGVAVDVVLGDLDVRAAPQRGRAADSADFDRRLAPAMRRAFGSALRESPATGVGWVGPGHLLLALLREADEPTAGVLLARGVTYDAARPILAEVYDWPRPPRGGPRRGRVLPPAGRRRSARCCYGPSPAGSRSSPWRCRCAATWP